MVLSIFAGFAPTFYLKPVMGTPQMLPLTPLVMLHGAVFSGWALLFVAQVWLVGAGRTDIHRRLGMAGFGLLVAMAILGTLAALHGVARASGPPIVPPLSWLAVPLLSIPVYSAMIGLGLANRRRPQIHKRYMYLAMVLMLGPSFGRMPPFHGPLGMVILPGCFILAQALWDWRTVGRVLLVTIWGGLAVCFIQFLPFLIWKTPAWLTFARWAVSFVS
jgi:hypothetical protein